MREYVNGNIVPAPVTHHRMSTGQLFAISETPLVLSAQTVNPVYSMFHFSGVASFLIVPFIGLTIKYWITDDSHTARNAAAWSFSVVGIVAGLMFSIVHHFMMSTEMTPWNKLNSRAPRYRNKRRSMFLIGIELVALTFSALAGVMYEKPS
jgi:hypothetical protein